MAQTLAAQPTGSRHKVSSDNAALATLNRKKRRAEYFLVFYFRLEWSSLLAGSLVVRFDAEVLGDLRRIRKVLCGKVVV